MSGMRAPPLRLFVRGSLTRVREFVDEYGPVIDVTHAAMSGQGADDVRLSLADGPVARAFVEEFGHAVQLLGVRAPTDGGAWQRFRMPVPYITTDERMRKWELVEVESASTHGREHPDHGRETRCDVVGITIESSEPLVIVAQLKGGAFLCRITEHLRESSPVPS